MAFTKITSTDLANKGVIGLPDVPGLSTSDMQNKLEETARSVIIPKHNALIDELEDTSAAASLGATAPTGLSGENVQALINDLNLKKENNSSSLPATNTAEGSDTFNIRKNTTTYKITFANLVASIKTAIGNATTAVSGLFSSEDKAKLNGIENNANNYSLPIASVSVLGGIKVGEHLSIDSEGVLTLEEGGEVLSVNGKTGIVTLDASDVNALPDNTPIPAKVSDLTNDSGFQTASDVSTSINTALTPYQTKGLSSPIAGQSTVEGAIEANASAISNKVDKVQGKGLSTNDYTDAEKEDVAKIDEIETALANKADTTALTAAIEGQQQLLEDTVGWVGGKLYVETEAGSINTTTGQNTDSDTVSRSVNYISVTPNKVYYANDNALDGVIRYFRYDEQKNYLGTFINTASSGIHKITIPDDTYYLRFQLINSHVVPDPLWIERASVEEEIDGKADNSVIAPVENGTTASQAYAVGEHFMNGGVLKEVTNAIANGEAINSGNTKDVKVSDFLAPYTTLASGDYLEVNTEITLSDDFNNYRFIVILSGTNSSSSGYLATLQAAIAVGGYRMIPIGINGFLTIEVISNTKFKIVNKNTSETHGIRRIFGYK